MSDSFSNFLKTGKLGSLALGLSQDDVLSLLGEPEDHTRHGYKPQVWKYGGLQIAFLYGKVIQISLNFDEYESPLPANLEIDGNIPSYKTDLNEFKHYLNNQGIGFEVNVELTFDDQTCLLLESGVKVISTSSRLNNILISSLV